MATTSILERILEVVNEGDKLGYTIFNGITEPYPCRSIDTVQKTEGDDACLNLFWLVVTLHILHLTNPIQEISVKHGTNYLSSNITPGELLEIYKPDLIKQFTDKSIPDTHILLNKFIDSVAKFNNRRRQTKVTLSTIKQLAIKVWIEKYPSIEEDYIKAGIQSRLADNKAADKVKAMYNYVDVAAGPSARGLAKAAKDVVAMQANTGNKAAKKAAKKVKGMYDNADMAVHSSAMSLAKAAKGVATKAPTKDKTKEITITVEQQAAIHAVENVIGVHSLFTIDFDEKEIEGGGYIVCVKHKPGLTREYIDRLVIDLKKKEVSELCDILNDQINEFEVKAKAKADTADTGIFKTIKKQIIYIIINEAYEDGDIDIDRLKIKLEQSNIEKLIKELNKIENKEILIGLITDIKIEEYKDQYIDYHSLGSVYPKEKLMDLHSKRPLLDSNKDLCFYKDVLNKVQFYSLTSGEALPPNQCIGRKPKYIQPPLYANKDAGLVSSPSPKVVRKWTYTDDTPVYFKNLMENINEAGEEGILCIDGKLNYIHHEIELLINSLYKQVLDFYNILNKDYKSFSKYKFNRITYSEYKEILQKFIDTYNTILSPTSLNIPDDSYKKALDLFLKYREHNDILYALFNNSIDDYFELYTNIADFLNLLDTEIKYLKDVYKDLVNISTIKHLLYDAEDLRNTILSLFTTNNDEIGRNLNNIEENLKIINDLFGSDSINTIYQYILKKKGITQEDVSIEEMQPIIQKFIQEKSEEKLKYDEKKTVIEEMKNQLEKAYKRFIDGEINWLESNDEFKEEYNHLDVNLKEALTLLTNLHKEINEAGGADLTLNTQIKTMTPDLSVYGIDSLEKFSYFLTTEDRFIVLNLNIKMRKLFLPFLTLFRDNFEEHKVLFSGLDEYKNFFDIYKNYCLDYIHIFMDGDKYFKLGDYLDVMHSLYGGGRKRKVSKRSKKVSRTRKKVSRTRKKVYRTKKKVKRTKRKNNSKKISTKY